MPAKLLGAIVCVAALAVLGLLGLRSGPAGPKLGGTETATGPASSAQTGRPTPLATATATPPTTADGSATPRNGRRDDGTVRAGESIAGVVRDSNGHPLGGAEVVLTVVSGSTLKTVSARAGPGGRFAIPAPIDGKARVLIRVPGHPVTQMDVVPEQPLAVELAPPARISGQVQGAGGQPLVGAFVRAERLERPGTPLASIQCGHDGRFILNGLAANERYRLSASHIRYAPGDPIEVTAPSSDVAITLYEGATLVVHVVGADGAPLTDLPKRAPPVAKTPWLAIRAFAELRGPAKNQTLTNWIDADPKRIKFAGLPAGAYAISAGVRGLGRGSLEQIVVPATGTSEVTLRFEVGGHVVLRARTADGKPAIDAEVQPVVGFNTPWGYLLGGRTDAQGKVRLGPVPPGESAWRARLDGPWAVATAVVAVGADVEVDIDLAPPGKK